MKRVFAVSLVALAVAAPLKAATTDLLSRLGRCETHLNYRFHNGAYEGFVAWYYGTWDLDKPSGYPDHAYQASPKQQRVVAAISLRRHRHFGCLIGPEHAWVRGG